MGRRNCLGRRNQRITLRIEEFEGPEERMKEGRYEEK